MTLEGSTPKDPPPDGGSAAASEGATEPLAESAPGPAPAAIPQPAPVWAPPDQRAPAARSPTGLPHRPACRGDRHPGSDRAVPAHPAAVRALPGPSRGDLQSDA